MPVVNPTTAGDIFEFRFKGVLNSQATLAVFHFRVSSLTGTPLPNSVADAINTKCIAATGVAAEALPLLPSNWTANGVECQRVFAKIDRSVIRSAPWNPPGTGGVALSSNVAQVITRRTDNAGRSQVSDLHLPLSTAAATITNGFLTAAQQLLMETYKPTLYTSFTVLAGAVTLTPVIWHRSQANPVLSYDVITSCAVQPTVRTMRSRNVGIGV